MQLVILPGNSLRNKEWADAAAVAAAGSFADIYTHHYQHWETGEETINFDDELERLVSVIPANELCAVFAKSAGAVLAIYGNYLGRLTLARCLFVGLPLGWSAEHQARLGEWLPRLTAPTTIIQNSDDPYSTYAQVKDFLAALTLPNVTLLETPGDNHDYLDFDLIKTKTPGFFSIPTNLRM